MTKSIDRVDKTFCTKFSSVKPLQPHISLVSKFSLLFCIIFCGTYRENLSNNQDLLILMTLMFDSGVIPSGEIRCPSLAEVKRLTMSLFLCLWESHNPQTGSSTLSLPRNTWHPHCPLRVISILFLITTLSLNHASRLQDWRKWSPNK